jgi:hypothetical protein
VASEVLDEAYLRLHHWGPEFGGENGLSNHGPMAAEVLSRRGLDDQVGSWLDRYVTRLETLPGEDDPITEDNWAEAMGQLRRVGDWIAFFRRAVREAPWPEVLAAWWPRLLPAIASGATHGLIRTGHAVRTVLGGDTSPEAVDEIAHALGYWAARAIFVPGLAGLAEAGVRQYATHGYGSPALLVHVATAPNAMGHLLPALPESLWPSSFAATWAACAAITVAHAPPPHPRPARLPLARPTSWPAPPSTATSTSSS